MLVQELSESDCFALLQRNTVGRLGYACFEQPYVVPVHFSFDLERQCFYGFSTIGDKVRCMRRNPRVCMEVDEIDDKDQWQTVVAIGRYREIQSDPAEEVSRERARELFQRRAQWWFPAIAKVGAKEHERAVIYRISIDRLTGRRATRQAQSRS